MYIITIPGPEPYPFFKLSNRSLSKKFHEISHELFYLYSFELNVPFHFKGLFLTFGLLFKDNCVNNHNLCRFIGLSQIRVSTIEGKRYKE